MVKRNPHLAKLHAGYLFPEIAKRKHAFLEKSPHAKLISLGIGDTTEPIPSCIAEAMAKTAFNLGTDEGYSGYGSEQGETSLREQIARVIYQEKISPDEIFISDGSKCDIGRLQVLFGNQAKMAVQDPSYPAYVDTSVILGQTHHYDGQAKHYKGIVYMPCTPSNQFFPDLNRVPSVDLIYFCSPNNPTGATATKEQLTELISFAKQNRSIIIFDAAYAAYIQDETLPRSIYEVEGAKEVAIELGSFSKMVGFTGVRLGWSVVPKELRFEDGFSVHRDWSRINATFFNGASNIAQKGGLAALQPAGLQAMQTVVHFYKENARLLRKAFEQQGYEVYGGSNAPYLWIRFPGMDSWQAFEMLLEKSHLICTPGSGFGQRSCIEEAIERLRKVLK
jgi:LL-diaminopimelate aminotransferase